MKHQKPTIGEACAMAMLRGMRDASIFILIVGLLIILNEKT